MAADVLAMQGARASVNFMAADVLVMQGARASASRILTQLNWDAQSLHVQG